MHCGGISSQQERLGSARLDNFASGLELIGQKLQMGTLQSRLDAEFLLAHMCSVKFKEWIVVLATLLSCAEQARMGHTWQLLIYMGSSFMIYVRKMGASLENVFQEQNITCKGLLWMGKIIPVCNYMDSSNMQNASKNQLSTSVKSPNHSLLEKACDLIKKLPENLDVVVSVARKTGRHWLVHDFSKNASKKGGYRTADCYILVIAKLEGPTVSPCCALRLLQETLDESLYELAWDLVWFCMEQIHPLYVPRDRPE